MWDFLFRKNRNHLEIINNWGSCSLEIYGRGFQLNFLNSYINKINQDLSFDLFRKNYSQSEKRIYFICGLIDTHMLNELLMAKEKGFHLVCFGKIKCLDFDGSCKELARDTFSYCIQGNPPSYEQFMSFLAEGVTNA